MGGLGRLAAGGDARRQGHEVEYSTLPVRSLLNRCTGVRMPFTWTINPYRGCEFACKYCYARYTHEFMEMRDGADFEQKIYVKQHAADFLRPELRQVKPGQQTAIGTATEPYQPAERASEVTRAILAEFARAQGLDVGIDPTGILVHRELGSAHRVWVSAATITGNLSGLAASNSAPALYAAAVPLLARAYTPTSGVTCSASLVSCRCRASSFDAGASARSDPDGMP